MSDMYNRIEKLCAEKNITRYQLSKATGISQGTFSDLKSGRRQNLSAKNLQEIADYFDVSVDYLLTGFNVDLAKLGAAAITHGKLNVGKEIAVDSLTAEIVEAVEALSFDEKEALLDYIAFRKHQLGNKKGPEDDET